MALFTVFLVADIPIAAFAEGLPSSTPVMDRPAVESLGNERYRVGKILVDKRALRMEVPGKVIRLEAPLEFIAVRKGGGKAYESFLELDSDAIEFNLACILIGLEAKKNASAEYHFDPRALVGDPLSIRIRWRLAGRLHNVPVESMIAVEEGPQPGPGWIYIGSFFTPDGQYLAQMDGTLIGFVHDPSSIIEHQTGIGLGDYGAVSANKNVSPPVGTAITLEIRRLKSTRR